MMLFKQNENDFAMWNPCGEAKPPKKNLVATGLSALGTAYLISDLSGYQYPMCNEVHLVILTIVSLVILLYRNIDL